MFDRYRNFKEMNDQELVDASFNIEKLLEQRLELRKNPKYIKKFKNQPPPNINPALIELRDNIANELKQRQKDKENEPKD